MKRIVLMGAATLLAAALLVAVGSKAERPLPLPAPVKDEALSTGQAVAVLAGGCFWGMEGVFEQVSGVKSVTSGYAGGTAATATYAQVSSETTRHAEAVRIVYDPRSVTYGTLLRVFFSIAHDPTQLNGQGPDRGPSYRSAIFAQTPEQEQVARSYIAQLSDSRRLSRPIVTRIEHGRFFPAEPEHQDFMRRHPDHPYIRRWDAPKVSALKEIFPILVK